MRHRTLISNRARRLRKSMSEPEVMLWSRLRGRSEDRPTFRRQHPIGSLILDFYCPSARLAIEVDGRSHWEDAAQARDEARDTWRARQGIAVVRIPASDVYRDLSGVTDGVLRMAFERQVAQPLEAGPSPSATRSSAGGPPPAASRGR